MNVDESVAWFFLVDGDDIGNAMENLLLKDDLANFVQASRKVTDSIDEIVSSVRRLEGAQVLTIGGDSVLIGASEDCLEVLLGLLDEMRDRLAMDFSVGYGRTLRAAHFGLRLAKTGGKSQSVQAPL